MVPIFWATVHNGCEVENNTFTANRTFWPRPLRENVRRHKAENDDHNSEAINESRNESQHICRDCGLFQATHLLLVNY